MKKNILIYVILMMIFSHASGRCLFDASGVCEKKIHNQQDIKQVKQKIHKKYYIALDEAISKHSLYIKPVVRVVNVDFQVRIGKQHPVSDFLIDRG